MALKHGQRTLNSALELCDGQCSSTQSPQIHLFNAFTSMISSIDSRGSMINHSISSRINNNNSIHITAVVVVITKEAEGQCVTCNGSGTEGTITSKISAVASNSVFQSYDDSS